MINAVGLTRVWNQAKAFPGILLRIKPRRRYCAIILAPAIMIWQFPVPNPDISEKR